MFRRSLIVIAAAVVVTYNSSPSSASADNTAGGAVVVSSAQAPVIKATTSLALNLGTDAQSGRFAIADVLTYGGSQPSITAPEGWELIRDDSTATTRQSLYWHVIGANDSSSASWTFSDPVDAQGAILLLDNVATDSPVDMSSGNTGGDVGGTLTAKSVATTSDGDLILAFNATDFGAFRPTDCKDCSGLNPEMPENMSVVVNHESTPLEYWILANAQSQTGDSEAQVSWAPQVFNWVAAQVAIKSGS
jgi:hypothetical protein